MKRIEIYSVGLIECIKELNNKLVGKNIGQSKHILIPQIKIFQEMKKDKNKTFEFEDKITYSSKNPSQLKTLFANCLKAYQTQNNINNNDMISNKETTHFENDDNSLKIDPDEQIDTDQQININEQIITNIDETVTNKRRLEIEEFDMKHEPPKKRLRSRNKKC